MMLEGFGGDRPVGVVRAAYRDAQEVHCIQLCDLANFPLGMDCIIIVGNSTTRMLKGKLVTARGYHLQQGKEV
jgi:precorrin-3B C17-methyltransferase